MRKVEDAGRCSCALTGPMELVYIAFYICAFHLAPRLRKNLRRLGPALAAVAIVSSLCLALRDRWIVFQQGLGLRLICVVTAGSGLTMYFVSLRGALVELPAPILISAMFASQLTTSMYFYDMESLEKGSFQQETVLQVLVSTCQPMLFIIFAFQVLPRGTPSHGAVLMRLAKHAGSAALGTYMFHYYFTPSAQALLWRGSALLHQFCPIEHIQGVLLFMWALALPLVFVFVVGPVFQQLLLLPIRAIMGK